MKIFISSLILMINILLALWLLLNPTITTISAFSQGNSVSIVPRAADPNNDQSFVPQFISMPIESTVFWTNDDSIPHSITSDEEGLFVSGPIAPEDTFENLFDTPGGFGYHCSTHPWMTGRVMVG